ncbi:MAG: hypothetical protein DWQ01_13330 [Planctomycetota bacterium]|nr:MAG: hypothetical protein DWQ01_13330 [Planctomycetota bacterium]
MPTGTIGYRTYARSAISGSSEDLFYPFLIDPGLLVAGTNVLAVEIHQSDPDSSDISFDLALWDSPPDELQRGPYLQLGTDEGVRIRWRTFSPSDSVVWYGSAPGNLTQSVSVPGGVIEHDVGLTGLQADTLYYYAVGSSAGGILVGDDSDHFFRTHPVPGTSRPVRIWALGDSGTANADARAVRDAYQTYTGSVHTDLWLMLGDNAYENGEDVEYQLAVFETYPEMLRKSVLWPTRGNHENSSAVYYGNFSMPTQGQAGGVASGSEAFYSFDFANVHFICLDSDATSRVVGGPMLTWLENDLASTTQDWIVAFWHHPPYTKGSHDSDDDSDSSGRMRDMRQNVLPILEDYGVDLVLSGHSHSYERSFLIDGHYGYSSSFDPPTMQLDGGDGRVGGDGAYQKVFGPHAGTVYCVAGSSGKVSSSGSLNHPVMYSSQRRLGSLILEVDQLQLDLKFLDENGVVQDFFTLLTGDAPLVFSHTGLFAGFLTSLIVNGAGPGNDVYFLYSLTGNGPTQTQFGIMDLTMPVIQIGPVTANSQGQAVRTSMVPGPAAGKTVYLQALEWQGPGVGRFSNALTEVVQ